MYMDDAHMTLGCLLCREQCSYALPNPMQLQYISACPWYSQLTLQRVTLTLEVRTKLPWDARKWQFLSASQLLRITANQLSRSETKDTNHFAWRHNFLMYTQHSSQTFFWEGLINHQWQEFYLHQVWRKSSVIQT